jgi:hypothetical protein
VRLAVEQLLASEGVARMIEEAQQLVLAPARGRADRCGAEARRFALEGAGERRAETLVLRSGADAEGLSTASWRCRSGSRRAAARRRSK